jgi:hypothetical protein
VVLVVGATKIPAEGLALTRYSNKDLKVVMVSLVQQVQLVVVALEQQAQQ